MNIFNRWIRPKQYDIPKLEPEQQIPQFETALKRNSASFSQLLEAVHGMNQGNEDKRNAYRMYHPYILEAFEDANGDILHLYLSSSTRAGVVLTKHAFFTHYDFQKSGTVNTFKAQELLIRCDRLAIEARRFLAGSDLHTCSELIYSAAENLLHFIDSSSEDNRNSDEINSMLKLIEEQLDYADAYHQEVLPLAYQRDYYVGMIGGFLLLVIIFVAIGMWISSPYLQGNELLNYEHLITGLIAGGMGAIVSMMSRLSSGDVDLKGKAGPTALRRAGSLRPFIGAIFGAVTYAVIESGLISHIRPTDENKLFLFAVVGFVAGFSERWAPDMLSTVVGDVEGFSQEKDEKDETATIKSKSTEASSNRKNKDEEL